MSDIKHQTMAILSRYQTINEALPELRQFWPLVQLDGDVLDFGPGLPRVDILISEPEWATLVPVSDRTPP